MIRVGVEQASLVKALKRVGIATISKTGNEQASKVLFRGKKGSTRVELLGTDRTVLVRSQVTMAEAVSEDFSFAVEMGAFQTLAVSLDVGPLVFEFDEKTEYLRFRGSGAKINLITVQTTNFKTFDAEFKEAKKVGEFFTKDMLVGLDYAGLFLSWSDDKDNKDPDSQILWVKNSEFVAGPGKVMGVYQCPRIPVEFKAYLTGVTAFQKYLRELSSEKCELFQYENVFYFVKPAEEEGEGLMFAQSPRNPPLETAPGDILRIFDPVEAFKVDRESIQRAITRVKVVLGDSQVVTFRLKGKANQARLTVIGEDSKHERSEVDVEVVRGVPTGRTEAVVLTSTTGASPAPTEAQPSRTIVQQVLDTSKVLDDREFKVNYLLLLALLKLSGNSVLTVGLSVENQALNIVEKEANYQMNALLGWVVN